MELKTYNTIIATLTEWDKEGKPYFYEISWESMDEPGKQRSWTGGSRETGVSKFTESVEKISKFTNCHKIHVVAYSGKTGKKEQMRETIKVNESYSSAYPVEQSAPALAPAASAPAPPQPAAQPGIDFISAILGFDLGGLQGTDKINGLLAFRDKQLENRFEMIDKERERMSLTLDKKNIEERLEEANERLEGLEEENDALQEELERVNAENQKLQKYIPENSAIGVSLSALGTSVLTGFAKRIALNNPAGIAKLLGTDIETLKGIFDSEPQTQVIAQEVAPVSVEVVAEEQVSTVRKQELAVVSQISDWLKTLDREKLGMVQTLCGIWLRDIETLPQIHDWATGTNQ